LRLAPIALLRLIVTFGLILIATQPALAESLPKSIVVMDFDLQDDTAIQGGPVDAEAQEKRLILAELKKQLTEKNLYRVIDNANIAADIAKAQEKTALSECNGCEVDIAKKAGAERVMACWVDKVSNLIINVNVGVKDVKTSQILYVRSADLRGNTDDSWLRAVKRVARDIEEQKLHLR
jgi:hypothetical protein